jgi:hypothetical protein
MTSSPLPAKARRKVEPSLEPVDSSFLDDLIAQFGAWLLTEKGSLMPGGRFLEGLLL